MRICHCRRKTIALSFFAAIFTANSVLAQTSTPDTNDSTLLESFIKSKNYSSTIDFNSSNIKQFWIDKSVFSKDNNIWITLQPGKGNVTWNSIPYGIQLANVNESLDCRIEVISNTPNVIFVVTDSKSKQLSSSKTGDDFMNYHISSATVHLEETNDFFFNMSFQSNTNDQISIKRIIMSFPTNKESSFLVTPGKIRLTEKDVKKGNTTSLSDGSFAVKDKGIQIFSKKKIFVTNNSLENNLTMKNIGDKPVKVYAGYQLYYEGMKQITIANYPYTPNSKTLNVISAEKGSSVIVVDSYPEWKAKCHLAINAKDDFSDIPNCTFLAGTIIKVEKLDNGTAEITMDKPLEKSLEKGTKVRVHGASSSYFYTNSITLNPDEEKTISSTLQKDNDHLEYTAKAFPKGTYYAIPLLLVNPVTANEECTIQIIDYSVSY